MDKKNKGPVGSTTSVLLPRLRVDSAQLDFCPSDRRKKKDPDGGKKSKKKSDEMEKWAGKKEKRKKASSYLVPGH